MAQSTLMVKKRTRIGKGGARKTRKEGAIPAVIYGRETSPISLTVDPGELKKALATEAGENTLLELHIQDSDNGEEVTKLAILREVQYNHLTNRPIHFDFLEILLKEKIKVEVPIRIIGKAEGVKEGGILEEIRREIEVECFPNQIPNVFEVDVSKLGIGDSIHISDLPVSEGVEILHDPEDTIVTVLAPRVEEEAKPAAEVEAEAAEAEEKEGEEEGDEE
ncbi:MAG TPA: 50S ribosomal protein L25/general stress protein Ctc [Thermodesulfobacteriota bacterium]|nr:50S ribosomal protein L25/general stress protein Ctc [Thermodesulfobacteriota bacterium]